MLYDLLETLISEAGRDPDEDNCVAECIWLMANLKSRYCWPEMDIGYICIKNRNDEPVSIMTSRGIRNYKKHEALAVIENERIYIVDPFTSQGIFSGLRDYSEAIDVPVELIRLCDIRI